ncbi:juvenile hormone acid O-methyltransferase-like [Schistocerca cancellata]|uniref:juvenile hormone acid O-methyltransferase-like n=1 Tax=Schistocerca cancellata TaxID=274614 RepID=UPI002118AF1E|nr:juvenile hormone acid O-methyltransferase-like [Schistocerca cancellata]
MAAPKVLDTMTRGVMDKPELYGRYSGPIEAAAARALDEVWPLLRWSRPALPILDIGCGPGDVAAKVLAPWLPRGTKIVACDLSAEMLRYAQANNSLPGVVAYERLDVTDALQLEQSGVWRRGPYSKAFVFLLLHWLPDNRLALGNIYKLLAPGGEALFTIITKICLYEAYEKMSQDPRWEPYMKDWRNFVSPYCRSQDAAKDFQELLQSEGFEVLYCSVRPEALAFASEEQIRVVLKSVNPFVNRVPEDHRAEFLGEVFQRFCRMNGMTKDVDPMTRETKYNYNYMSMTALARKAAKLCI